MKFRRIVQLFALAPLAFTPRQAGAQDSFTQQCASAGGSGRTYCERVGQTAAITMPRLGIALSGGNPVPGTASTLGMRLGSIPRISFDLRGNAAYVDMPDIKSESTSGSVKYAVTSMNADASVGVFSGLSVFPTIGGFGSVDVLASAGVAKLPQSKGFTDGSAKSWGVGARVGILRESFTAPGISVSGMYRKVGDVAFGDSTLTTSNAYFAIENMSAWSYRAAISKRIPLIGFGATAGVGVDKYSAASAMAAKYGTLLTSKTSARTDKLKQTRKSAFVNASWTLLLLNIAGEVGWQEGGSAPAGGTIATDRLEKAGYFAGVAVRISL